MKRFWTETKRKAIAFALTPAAAYPLAALRLGIAGSLLIQAYFLSADFFDLYGRSGILQGTLGELSNGPRVIPLSLAVSALTKLGLTDSTSLSTIACLYLGSLLALLVGLRARVAASLAWLAHLLLFNSHATVYGADSFANVFLFYLIWIPSSGVWSLDQLTGRMSAEPTPGTRLGLRILQVHMGIAYFFSGYEKALGEQWWNGEAIWRSLMLPLYNQFDFGWLASYPKLALMAGLGTLVIEIGYPIFIWPAKTRKLWVALTLSLHIGIAVFLGLGVFGLLMSVLTFSLFGISAEPRVKNATRSAFAPLEVAV